MANAEYPWFPFYARDWLTDSAVVGMTAMVRGCYVQLLCYQWENGGLPDDTIALVQMCGLTGREVQAMDLLARHDGGETITPTEEVTSETHALFETEIWPQLERLFPKTKGDGRLRNSRLEKERLVQEGKHEAFRRAGQESGRARRERRSNDARTRLERGLNILDADADADEDKKKNIGLTPSVANATAESVVNAWNELAKKHKLPLGRMPLSPKRHAAARQRLKDHGSDFWPKLDEALPKRSEHFRKMRFPNLDQAVRPDTLDRLLDGVYLFDPSEDRRTLRQKAIPHDEGPTTVTLEN